MFGRLMTICVLSAMIALTLFTQSTTPSSAGPGGILTVFFLLYVIVVGVVAWLLYVLSFVTNIFIVRLSNVRKKSVNLSTVQAYYYSSVISLGIIMLFAMKSVGGAIGLTELLLVILFEVTAIFYINKRFK